MEVNVDISIVSKCIDASRDFMNALYDKFPSVNTILHTVSRVCRLSVSEIQGPFVDHLFIVEKISVCGFGFNAISLYGFS